MTISRKHLPNVTLICVDCKYYGAALASMQQALKDLSFARAVFITDKQFEVHPDIETVIIPKITTKQEYSRFMIKDLHFYFDTEFCLVVQHDGMVLDGKLWEDAFLEADYIGSRWPETDGLSVGNGGFSLRSHRLCKILSEDENVLPHGAEDVTICRTYRPYLEAKYGLKWASEEVADRFSFELIEPTHPTFGKHGNFWHPYTEHILIKRMGAMGDVIAAEPLMRYLWENGAKVVLETSDEFYQLFRNHDFPIIGKGQLNENMPYTEVNLDMVYEAKPKQLHLKSYFEFCGIKDAPLKKPRLFPRAKTETKMFDKYVVLHIDERPQPGRNILGVDWEHVVEHLSKKGYTVIQIGKRMHGRIDGATYMNTASLNMLQYLISGADMFIGIDSGPSNIAVACDVPSAIFFGNVNPFFIHPDVTNVEVILANQVCDKPFCWHEYPGTTGQECYIDAEKPPCTMFKTERVLSAIRELTRI